jgi:hypothetical protein
VVGVSFFVGVLVGAVVVFFVVRAAYRAALTEARRMRDFWRETAEHRAVELEGADVAGEVAGDEIARLLEENRRLIAEANALRVAVRQGGAR